MKRLLQRRSVQESLEAVEKEMGGRSMSLAELQELMTETGALAAAVPGKRIAADAHTRFILLTGTSPAADDASQMSSNTEESASRTALSAFVQENTSVVDAVMLPIENISEGCFEEYYSDEEITEQLPEFDYAKTSKVDSDDFVSKQLKAAHNFIFENSGLTQEEIYAVIKDHSSTNKFTFLDQPSTSKAGCSNIVEVPNPKHIQDNSLDDKSHTPSTAPWSEFDMLLTSKDFRSECSGKESEQSNVQNEVILSSSNSKTATFICDLKDNVMIVNTEQSDNYGNGVKKEESDKRKIENKRLYQQPPDLYAGYPGKLPGEKGIYSQEGYHLSSISVSTNIIFPKVHLEANVEEIIKSPAPHSSLDTSESAINISAHSEGYHKDRKVVEEKKSCSSDEDFVEVAEMNQSAINFKAPHTIQTKVAPLEVVIKTSVTHLEEDIFADVFETHSKPLEEFQPNILKHSMEKDNTLQNVMNTSMYSKTILEDTPQSTLQHFQEVKNGEIKESTVPVSPSKYIMAVRDSGSEVTEEITNSPADSEESSYNKPRKETVKPTELLEKLQDSLQQEGNYLQREQAREERLAASITDQMVQEAQELLQLFGVPYVVAPMEAEAQCAFLDHLSLTDGTITDDSDIWLFGGQKVYKNFFDQKKHVLQYRDIDILHSFKLTRSQLVLLALLVGSDYTTGLPGVGPVTALEILAAFPAKSKQGPPDELVEGLRRFREWYTSGTAKRWDKAKLRNKLKDLELTGEFPSVSVVEAYLSPKVDESMEKFSWGTPDVESIKEFARAKFGWPTSKTHEILQPIMKQMNIKIAQLTIETYFKAKPTLPPGGGNFSKRVQQAIEKIGASEDSVSENAPPPGKKIKTISESKNAGMSEKVRIIQASLTKVKGSASSSRASRVRGRGERENNVGGQCGDSLTNEGSPGNSIPDPSTDSATATNNNGNFCSKKFKTSESFVPHSGKEFILQKEKDKLNLLKNKLRAIEMFRKSARGLDKTHKDRKKKIMVLKQAHLSESSESD